MAGCPQSGKATPAGPCRGAAEQRGRRKRACSGGLQGRTALEAGQAPNHAAGSAAPCYAIRDQQHGAQAGTNRSKLSSVSSSLNSLENLSSSPTGTSSPALQA